MAHMGTVKRRAGTALWCSVVSGGGVRLTHDGDSPLRSRVPAAGSLRRGDPRGREPDEGESLENPKRSLRVGRNDQGLRERVREG